MGRAFSPHFHLTPSWGYGHVRTYPAPQAVIWRAVGALVFLFELVQKRIHRLFQLGILARFCLSERAENFDIDRTGMHFHIFIFTGADAVAGDANARAVDQALGSREDDPAGGWSSDD